MVKMFVHGTGCARASVPYHGPKSTGQRESRCIPPGFIPCGDPSGMDQHPPCIGYILKVEV